MLGCLGLSSLRAGRYTHSTFLCPGRVFCFSDEENGLEVHPVVHAPSTRPELSLGSRLDSMVIGFRRFQNLSYRLKQSLKW